MTNKTPHVADELKRIRSILSAITGFEDDNQEYVEDARKSADRVIEALAGQAAQQERPSFAEWTSDYVRDNLHKLKPAPESGNWYAVKEIDAMVRDLDVAMNGEGAAQQAKLCDLMPTLIKRLTEQPAPAITPEQLLALAQTASLGLDKVIEAFKMAAPKVVDCHATGVCVQSGLRAEQPAQQEPVAVVETRGGYPDESRHEAKWLVPYRALKEGDKLYTTPPQRKPLTDEQVWNDEELMKLNAVMMLPMDYFMRVVRAIEAAHGIKDTLSPPGPAPTR